MNTNKLVIIIAAIVSALLIGGIFLVACNSQATPAAPPSPMVQEDDDDCLSLEELIERDEDCGYSAKSPKPRATRTTAPVKPPANPPRTRGIRR